MLNNSKQRLDVGLTSVPLQMYYDRELLLRENIMGFVQR